MFQDVLIVLAQDKQEAFKGEVNDILSGYFAVMDAAEEKRIKDGCKSKLTELQIDFQKWQTKQKQLAAEEAKSGAKAEETKKEAAVFEPWEQFMEATGVTDPNGDIDATSGKVLSYLGGDLL